MTTFKRASYYQDAPEIKNYFEITNQMIGL